MYILPNYTKNRASGSVDYVADVVVQMKRKFNDPYLVIVGDFNQWKVEEGLEEHPEIREVLVGNTRNNKAINRIFTNMSRSVYESGTLDPLETEAGEEDGQETRRSDHRIAFCRFGLKRKETFTWETFSYRHYSEEAVQKFKQWLVFHHWEEVLEAEVCNNKANAYQQTINWAVETFFPLKTTRRKSNDLPWLNKKTLQMIDTRRRLYMSEGGRTVVWKEKKKEVDKAIRDRKRGYMSAQKNRILEADANRNFFRHVRSFSRVEKPKQFDVRDILPGRSDQQVAEELADFFNKVSREFDPLEPGQIPVTKPASLPRLHKHDVSSRLKHFCKPKSMVPGDVFPRLVTDYANFFAIPLTDLYNGITETKIWPRNWKKEFVTVIPKKPSPQTLSDTHNISCTMPASKVFESYVLDWLKSEVSLCPNQYGRVKGMGTDHVLLQLWQGIL